MAQPELLENIKKLDPKFSILDDLFNGTEENAQTHLLIKRLRERIEWRDSIIKELLDHIKKVDPCGYSIVYQRLISGRPTYMQKRYRAR